MKRQGELSIIDAYGRYSKTLAKHAPVVGNSVLNLFINILGSGSMIQSNTQQNGEVVRKLTERERYIRNDIFRNLAAQLRRSWDPSNPSPANRSPENWTLLM